MIHTRWKGKCFSLTIVRYKFSVNPYLLPVLRVLNPQAEALVEVEAVLLQEGHRVRVHREGVVLDQENVKDLKFIESEGHSCGMNACLALHFDTFLELVTLLQLEGGDAHGEDAPSASRFSDDFVALGEGLPVGTADFAKTTQLLKQTSITIR